MSRENKAKKVIVSYDPRYSEYQIPEPDGNIQYTDSEDDAVNIAKTIWGDQVKVVISDIH